MLVYPQMDPVAFRVGPLAVHWYGVMYLVGFLLAWIALAWRVRNPARGFTRAELPDIFFYGALGVIIGGRLGYLFFYDFAVLLQAPWQVFMIWQGGMSFHGGLMGVIVALYFYARKTQRALIDVTDFIAPVVPLGLATGRIGNFINGELWGRVTTVPWGMVYPGGGPFARHPSELYEFLLEGVLLFLLMWWYSKKMRPRWAVSGFFLLFYGIFRCIAECFREPDSQIGFIAFGWMTKGQLLSLPMIVIGAACLLWAYRRTAHATIS